MAVLWIWNGARMVSLAIFSFCKPDQKPFRPGAGATASKPIALANAAKCYARVWPLVMGPWTGRICLIESAKDIERFVDGSILVTEITDPDWTPVMKRAAAIITDHGGSHVACRHRKPRIGAACRRRRRQRDLLAP